MGQTPVTGTQSGNTPPQKNRQPTGSTFEDTALADERLAGVPEKQAPNSQRVAVSSSNPFGPLHAYESIRWYHGTRDRVTAGRIRHHKQFDPDATGGFGKAYGPGTYFAPTESTARRYGEYVFSTDLQGLRLLVVQQGARVIDHTDLSWLETDLTTDQKNALVRSMRTSTSGNTYATVANWARDDGFDGLHLKGVEEVEIATVFSARVCGELCHVIGT